MSKTLVRFELRVRPVAAPHQAMQAEGRFQKTERLVRVIVIRAKLAPVPICRRYLHPHAPRLRQFQKTAKARVTYAAIGIGPAEMIDDDIHTSVQKRLDDAWQPRSFRMHFDMPFQRTNMRERLRAHPAVERQIRMPDQETDRQSPLRENGLAASDPIQQLRTHEAPAEERDDYDGEIAARA